MQKFTFGDLLETTSVLPMARTKPEAMLLELESTPDETAEFQPRVSASGSWTHFAWLQLGAATVGCCRPQIFTIGHSLHQIGTGVR